MTDVDVSKRASDRLGKVAELSDDMRILEDRVKQKAKERRAIMRALRDEDKVAVSRIAEAAKTSSAAVQATLRIDAPAKPEPPRRSSTARAR